MQMMELLQNQVYCDSTSQNYHVVWKLFNKFLIKLDNWPESWEGRVALWVTHMIKSGLQSSTVRSYISAVKASLRLIDYEWNNSTAKLVAITKACRLKNDESKARLPIHIRLLNILLHEIDRFHQQQPYLNILYKAMFAVAYFGLFRVGEIAAGRHSIKACNVHQSSNQRQILFVMYSSKTHNKARPPQKVTITSRMGEELGAFCPVQLILDYLEMRGDYTSMNDNLFVFRGGIPVPQKAFRKLLRQLLKRVGLQPEMYDTHSFRIGRATDLRKAGVNVETIKHLGRWRSNAVYNYFK